jgi:hypothetical protein
MVVVSSKRIKIFHLCDIYWAINCWFAAIPPYREVTVGWIPSYVSRLSILYRDVKQFLVARREKRSYHSVYSILTGYRIKRRRWVNV